ncbi:MAG: FGGY-family carbohydrate kinase [Gammaproteobacteria bacterium]|nr:FGGY-family carbohydrate kinase [Gammaproteobacteria bacterium]
MSTTLSPSSTPAGLFLGIDFGTSGCRAVLVDGRGEEVGRTQVPLPAPEGSDGHAEQAPALWWEALVAVVRALGLEARPAPVVAVAVDGTSASLLLADAGGRPLGPALMYNDRRSVAEAAAVARVAPPGSAAHGPTAALAKLLHLAPRHGAAAHALHQADWVTGRLLGRFGHSDENNALKLGYDPAARQWPAWLDELGVERRLLPAVVPPGTPLGTVGAEAARELRLGGNPRVMAGTTDSTAAFIAAGASDPGDAVTSLGSTLVLKVLATTPVSAPEYGVYSHRLGDVWLAGGASNSGGAALLRHFDHDQLQALTPRLCPDEPTGLDYYPLPASGERFPVSDSTLTPREAPRPADDVRFLQGLLEGMAAIEARGYRLLQELGAPYPRRVITTGGGAANQAWRVMRERALGVPVTVATHGDAAYGAALLALRGCRDND